MLPTKLLLEIPVNEKSSNVGFDSPSHWQDESDYKEAEFVLSESRDDGSAVYVYDSYYVVLHPDNTLSPIEPL